MHNLELVIAMLAGILGRQAHLTHRPVAVVARRMTAGQPAVRNQQLLADVPELKVNGTLIERHPGNLNIRVPGIEALADNVVIQGVHPLTAGGKLVGTARSYADPSLLLRQASPPRAS